MVAENYKGMLRSRLSYYYGAKFIGQTAQNLFLATLFFLLEGDVVITAEVKFIVPAEIKFFVVERESFVICAGCAFVVVEAEIVVVKAEVIIRRSIAGIMDEADIRLITRMVKLLNANRQVNWVDMHNLRIIKYGTVLHMDCHLTVPWYFNVNEAHKEIDILSDLVRKEFGETLELFVHSDGCLYSQCSLCSKPGCPVRQHEFENRVEWTLDNIQQNQKHKL